ncbi:MAG: phosphotransferase [Chitinivibrionales bacterium]|nr:phosphotransferase [Chitinivibrionales bacterium]MBD3357002.1 phosphotransferase [Chitinivibrionales bacterium]
MTYARHPGDAEVRACFEKHYTGCTPVCIEPITTGLYNASYFISCSNEEFVLRVAPLDEAAATFYERHMMHQEPALHSLLHEKTTVPLPRILAFDTDHDIVDRDFLLMERLPGAPLSDAVGVNNGCVFRQIGKHLAQVHALTAPTFGYRGDHKPMTPQNTWTDAFCIMWRRLVEDVSRSGMYNAREAKMVSELVEEHSSLFSHCRTASLLHMDIWSQNILVDSASKVTGIIDWDRALWGDPEIEFAVLDYCGISEPPFWEGYGQPRPEGPQARLRNAFYLLYELQKYIPINILRKHNPSAAHACKYQVMDLIRRTFTP